MAEAEEEIANRATQQYVSVQMNKFSSDLIERLVSKNHFSEKLEEQSEETEEIELSLGLSLNGRFGIDPRTKNNYLSLKRSSSISDFTTNPNGGKGSSAEAVRHVPTACPVPLTRTCSLPMETEEEWRKRKELQTLRRMEAKRKRSEKQRNSKGGRDHRSRAPAEENGEEDSKSGVNGSLQQPELSSMVVPAWVSGSRVTNGDKDHGTVVSGGIDGLIVPPQPSYQGSIGSHGSGSSGISESNSQAGQGVNKCPEIISPASVQSMPESEKKLTVSRSSSGTLTREKSGVFNGLSTQDQSAKAAFSKNGNEEIARNVLEDMPCVSTTGVGPNGKRIEGFLYRYRKGEEVRIVCVCHGSFLSPAEFVKHAGGGDVAHPLKHIVVNPTPFL